MKIKLIVLSLVLAIMTGCTSTIYKKPPANNPSDDATIKLAEAANSVSDSMRSMAVTEKVLTPPPMDNTLTIPNTRGLRTHASVDWAGPIAEVTARVARAAHYRLRILGKSPAIPILVNVNVKDQSLGDILRNIDYQAANKASIHVYPSNQVVELRYANIYS